VRRGGWCIRMGAPSMKPLPPMPRVIDYARSVFKSDLMDVFLCARCRFFLGSSSGLFLISSAFGVPAALTNMAPLGCGYGFSPKDLSIPKLYLSRAGVMIPFSLILPKPLADFRWAYLLQGSEVELQENTAEDILDLTVEMLDRLDGVYVQDVESELMQDYFRDLFNENNYCWGSPARIGDAFLRKYQNLLLRPDSDERCFNPLPWSNGPLRNPAAGTRRRDRPAHLVFDLKFSTVDQPSQPENASVTTRVAQ
jgi:putative glycosyltransferase (TIGR04372 family)